MTMEEARSIVRRDGIHAERNISIIASGLAGVVSGGRWACSPQDVADRAIAIYALVLVGVGNVSKNK